MPGHRRAEDPAAAADTTIFSESLDQRTLDISNIGTEVLPSASKDEKSTRGGRAVKTTACFQHHETEIKQIRNLRVLTYPKNPVRGDVQKISCPYATDINPSSRAT